MSLLDVDRYDPDRVPDLGERAVVAGGSMAGLCAARVLADAFAEVVVVERDPLPDEPVVREGAPQTAHPHIMLEAGRELLEDFFPGFGEAVLSAGGLLVDAARDVTLYDRGGRLADGPERLPTYCASRPLFEHVVRRHLFAHDSVRVRGGSRLVGYRLDGSVVTGATVRDGDGETTLDADLVVDATGRTSRTPDWLADGGYERPPVEAVSVDLSYSTVRVERPPDDRRLVAAAPEPPETRGGALIPVEGDRWELILQGVHGDDTPTEREAFVDFAESLPVDAIGTVAADQPWVSDVDYYPFPASRRNRYGALDRFPDGLVVTGDAVASFNPVYGQGMSVAAMDALLLHHALADGLDGLGPRFFASAAPVIDAVWRIAVGNDFRFDETEGPKPRGTDLFNRYVTRLVRRAHHDGELADAYLRVFRLERHPTTLLRPGVVWRALRPAVLG